MREVFVALEEEQNYLSRLENSANPDPALIKTTKEKIAQLEAETEKYAKEYAKFVNYCETQWDD